MEKVSSLLLAECYDSLAVSLAGREGHATTWEELQPLVGACMAVAATGDDAVPLRMPRGDNCDALIIGKPTTCLNAREQLAVLALAKFVRASRGQYLRELVPLLIRYLPAIAEYSWAIPRPWTAQELPAMSFTYSLTRRLLDIAAMPEAAVDHQEPILRAVCEYLEKLIRILRSDEEKPAHVCQTILPSLDGLLRALSIPPFWGHHSTSEALIRAALPLLERDTTACVERAIKAYRADANPFGGSSSIGQFLRDSFFVDNRVVTGSLRILRNTLLYVGGTSHRVFEKQWRTAAVDLADSHLEDRHPVRGCIDDVLEACSQQFGEAVGHLRTVSDDDENGETILAYYREIAELATQNLLVYSYQLDEPQEEVMTLFRDILLGQERMQINDAVLISVIHVLGWSGLRFESATADCYDVLQKFLTSHAEAMSSFEDSEKLLVAHVAASYLTKLMQRVDTELPLISLTNALCSSGDNVDNQACLTALVGRVARHANQEMVGEMVLPILIRQFHECRDSNLIAGATLNQLVDLAFINGMESFEEVVNTLAFTSRAVSALSDASNMFVLRMVTAKQMEIARRSAKADRKFLDCLLTNIFRLFRQKAGAIDPRRLTDETFYHAQLELIWLLYIIQELSKHIPDNEWTVEMLQSFRSIWFTAIRFGLTVENMWKEHWRGGVAALAKCTPYLLDNGIAALIDSELESDASVMGEKTDGEELRRMRNLLAILMPKHQDVHFTLAQCLFLLTVYHSEMFEGMRYGRIFRYVLNMPRSEMTWAVSALVNKVFEKTVEKYRKDQNSKVAVRALTVGVILEYPASTDAKCQRLVLNHLESMFTSFPYLLWDAEIIMVALETLQMIYTASVDDFLGKNIYTYDLTCDDISRRYKLSRGSNFREQLCEQFVTFVEDWLSKGIQKCPSEMNAALQNFLGRIDETKGEFVHVGITISTRVAVRHGLYQVPSLPLTGFAHAHLANNSTRLVSLLGRQLYNRGGYQYMNKLNAKGYVNTSLITLKQELQQMATVSIKKDEAQDDQSYELLFQATAALRSMDKIDYELLHLLCWVPIQIFSAMSLQAGIDAWVWLISSRPDLELRIMNELADVWEWTIRRGRGIFSQKYNVQNAFAKKMTTGPTKLGKDHEVAFNYFLPHLIFIDFLISHFDLVASTSEDHMSVYYRIIQASLYKRGQNSNHPLARLCYAKLWTLAWKILDGSRMNDWFRGLSLKVRAYESLINLFAMPVTWNGFDQKYISADIRALYEVYVTIKADHKRGDLVPSKTQLKKLTKERASQPTAQKVTDLEVDIRNDHSIFTRKVQSINEMRGVAIVLLELELRRLKAWFDPVGTSPNNTVKDIILDPPKRQSDSYWRLFITFVWNVSPRLALQLSNRLASPVVNSELQRLITREPASCILYPDAAMFLATQGNVEHNISQLKYLTFWAPITPIQSIAFARLPFGENPYVLQFALRSLDSFPVETTFFYVPQIVQALRYDVLGYVEKYITETAKISQLFAHQIIWNMKANELRDEETMEPDPLKPLLDRVTERIVGSLSGKDKDFYEREFTFFEKVTSISGALKPFIRRTKQEKKQKIYEELRKISVDPGVYLPSNPESIVVDIDYDSGRPLQSHAKAPFMATFKIRAAPMEVEAITQRQTSFESLFQDDQNDTISEEAENEETSWQSAIFKVGDDCRQDLLALQLISILKNIFTNAGLNLYLFPYRIVATAPGCGVIEVVPRSVSRDQMGRGNVNDLHKWFLMKFGEENTVKYQKAQDAFVESLAAYSIVLYLLQIKDRHNGNVMLTEEGQIVHIDFGFIFDIVPGGVKFERSPFKLTKEMVDILGGSREAANYRRFVELCARGFLVCRPYAEQIISMVKLMLDSGLPCFKAETTIRLLRQRFMLDLSEQAAADYMVALVHSAHRALSTTVYDAFQKATNGIPF